jgi:hypothetical protein
VLGFINAPVFALADAMRKQFGDNAIADKAIQTMFGYVNGAAAFAEQLLETTPYGLIKAAMMKGTKVETLEEQIYRDQRVRDLVVKPIASFALSAALIAISKSFCKDDAKTVSNQDIQDGSGLVICGYKIPSYILGMNSVATVTYNYFHNLMVNNEDFNIKDVTTLAYLATSQRYDDKNLLTGLKDMTFGKANDDQKRKIWETLVTNVVDGTLSTIVPFPSRPINELGALYNTMVGGKKQVSKSFQFESEFTPKIENIFNYTKYATYQALGLKDFLTKTTEEAGKYDYYDYRGRLMFNTPSKGILGIGIKYDKYDDLINKLSLDEGRLLFNSPYRVLYDSDYKKDPSKDKRRYMTEKEYSLSQKASGEILDKFIKDNYEKFSNDIDKKAVEQSIKSVMVSLERATKKAVEDNNSLNDYKLKIYELTKKSNQETKNKYKIN